MILVSLIASGVLTTQPIHAVSRTITVPDNYPTITAALRFAASGDTVFVKKGIYTESTLVISKAISLMGEDANNTIIRNIDNPPWDFSFPPPPPTVAIQISADNIHISGFTITGAIIGIAGKGDGTQITRNIIENSNIDLEGTNQVITGNDATGSLQCSGSYNNITSNDIAGNHEGIIVEGSFNLIYGNILIDGISAGGISVYGNENVIAKNNITNCNGGISIERGSNNSVYANRIAENGGGLRVLDGYNNVFYANAISNKYYGSIIGAGTKDITGQPLSGNNTIYHNNFVNNTYQVKTTYTVYGTDFWDNGSEGNYWSDYTGNDTNDDGIGDTPYIIDESRRDNFPLMFPFDIENNTIVFPTAETETQPTTTTVIAAATVVTAAIVGSVVYIKKRKH